MELDHEELSTKFDEANQTIRELRIENNFLTEKTKKLEADWLRRPRSLKQSYVKSELNWIVFEI